MILRCDANLCIDCMDGQCQRVEVTLEDGYCLDYQDVTDGPDYNEPYFVACRYRPKDGGDLIFYRKQQRGKAVEVEGMTFYTREDIRFGWEHAWFTEAQTGYLCKGEDLLGEEGLEEIRKTREEKPPVLSLPWMDENLEGPPTPHEEKRS